MSSYFSSTGTRIGANTATGEVKAFDSAKFHSYTTDDVYLGQEELTKALKDLGSLSDTEACELAKSIIKENGGAPSYDDLIAILNGDGDNPSKVDAQEVRIAAEIAANGGTLKSGEGMKDLQNASKLFNDQNNLDSEKVKGVLANLIDSNGKLLTGTAAQDAEDQILLALFGVGASEAEVTTILNAIHNGTDNDRKNIVAEIINSAGGSTQEQERGGISSTAATRKTQFGDVKGGGTTENPDTPTDNKYTTQQFTDAIKKSDGGIDDTKFKDLLVSMGVAKDAAGAEKLTKQLVASYKASKGGDEPDAKEMAEFINAHNTGSDKIDPDEVAFSTFETTSDPRLYNKDRLKAFIDNAKPEMKEKVLKGMIRMYGEVPDGEVQAVYDKIKDKSSQDIVNTLIGTDKTDAKKDEIKTNVQNLKGGGAGDPNKKYSKEEFRNAVKDDSGQISIGKLAQLLEDLGIAKDEKSVELANKLISLHNPSSPDALYDALDNVIHQDNIIMKGDLIKGLFAKKEGDKIVYDKASFKLFLDDAKDDVKKDFLKNMFKNEGGLNDGDAENATNKLLESNSDEIANLVFSGADKVDYDAFKGNVSRIVSDTKTLGKSEKWLRDVTISDLDNGLKSEHDKSKEQLRNEYLNPIRERRVPSNSSEYAGKSFGDVGDELARWVVDAANGDGGSDKVKEKLDEIFKDDGKIDKILEAFPEAQRKAVKEQLTFVLMQRLTDHAKKASSFNTGDSRLEMMDGIGEYINSKQGDEKRDLHRSFVMSLAVTEGAEKLYKHDGKGDYDDMAEENIKKGNYRGLIEFFDNPDEAWNKDRGDADSILGHSRGDIKSVEGE